MKQLGRISFLGLGLLLVSGCSMMEELNSSDLSALSQDILDGSAPSIGTNVEDSRISGILTAAKGLTLSDEEVHKTALGYSKNSDRENKVAPASNPYAIRLKRLVEKHIKEDGLKLDFKVYLSPEINAFALANGSVRVYSGLMDRMKDDELLSVIGHEIGHIKLGHSKSQLQKAYLAEAAISSGVGELRNGVGSTAAGLAGAGIKKGGDILQTLLEAQFSQSDEEEADDYGLAFLQKNKYDSSASPRALRKLEAISDSKESFIGTLFSTHPDSGERAARIEERLNLSNSVAANSTSEHIQELGLAKTNEASVLNSLQTSKPLKQAVNLKKESTTGPWYIQVAAPIDEILAREMLSSITETGAKGKIREIVVKNELRYRVLVGPYNTKVSAQEDLERITNLEIKEGQPFVRKGEL